jgi:hypothetical protein
MTLEQDMRETLRSITCNESPKKRTRRQKESHLRQLDWSIEELAEAVIALDSRLAKLEKAKKSQK